MKKKLANMNAKERQDFEIQKVETIMDEQRKKASSSSGSESEEFERFKLTEAYKQKEQ